MGQPMEAQAMMWALMALKKDLDEIKRDIKGKTPIVRTEEAVEGFKAFLGENAKPNTIKGFRYLLSEFGGAFQGQNMAEIAPVVLQGFLGERWGSGKKSVLKQNFILLKWFYTWSIKYCQKMGGPPFANPCDFIEVKRDDLPKRPDFVPVEKMREFLGTAKTETHWLMFAVLMTAGLRASELVGDEKAGKKGLLKKDVYGRVLTITSPKSGKTSEAAVIPDWVAVRLDEYAKGLAPEDKVFKVSYSTLYDVITTHAKWVGLDLAPHGLRKWCATFWNRLYEYGMTNFVLRHSGIKVDSTVVVTSLGGRYIAPLSAQEVMEKQDRHMMQEGLL